MDYRPLGETGLTVSAMGLGCGGYSKLGIHQDPTGATTRQVLITALDQGITLFDTAEAYRNETHLGQALADLPRRDLVLSSKIGFWVKGKGMIPDTAVMTHLEESLHRLGTDFLDIYHIHGVRPDRYDWTVEEIYPQLALAKEQGKIRCIGITESFDSDPGHTMLMRAVEDDLWDVAMVGFNLLNPSARERVLPRAREKGIGTLCMHAVRRALQSPETFANAVNDLHTAGLLDPSLLDLKHPAEDLVEADGSLTEMAYRFCRHEPGLDCILSGTGNPAHVISNAAALNRPPLPSALQERLARIFGHVDSVSGH